MPVNIGVNIQRSPNRINQQLREAGVEGKFPKLLLDFKDQYYLASGGSKTLANAVTHVRSGNAVMTDGYGPELVTNGSYSDGTTGWTANEGFTVNNGVATVTTTSGSAAAYIQQSFSTVNGKTYILTYNLVSRVPAFKVSIDDDSFTNQGDIINANYNDLGQGSIVFTATSSTAYLRFISNTTTAGKSVSFDNVSVREMPVLKWAPHNLCRNSEDATASNFFKSNVTVSSVSSVTAPNGTTGVNKYEFAGAAGDNVYITDGGADIRGGVTGTFAVFAKAVSSATTIRMRIWDNGSTGAQYVDKSVSADDWTLLTHEATTSSNSTTANFAIYNNSSGNASDIYVWGFHIFRSDLGGMVDNPERGDSYVPTALRPFGANLITNGTFDTDTTGWAGLLGASLSVVNGALRVAEDGNDSSTARAYQSFSTEIGKAYEVKVDYVGGTGDFGEVYINNNTNFGGAFASDSSIVAGTTSTIWFVATATTTFILLGAGPASEYNDYDNISVRESSVRPDTARYLPRIGHHVYNGSAWVNEGVFAESEARTNLATYSDDFSNAFWSKVSATITSDNAISPIGTESADKITATGDFTRLTFSSSGLTDNADYFVSLYAKQDSAYKFSMNFRNKANTSVSTVFNLQAGTATGDGLIEDVGNGWFRCGLSFNLGSGATTPDLRAITYVSPVSSGVNFNNGESIFIYGAQVEAGSTPSSLIPTSGSSVTRAAETFTIPSANLPWPSPQYIGSELVTNGTFDTDSDWTKGTGWAISGGTASSDGTQTARSSLYQSPLTVGKLCELSMTVTGRTAGSVRLRNGVGAAEVYIADQSSDGTYTGIAKVSGGITLVVDATADFVGSIDSVSVREINPLSVSIAMDGRMTYADTNTYTEAVLFDWDASASVRIRSFIHTSSTNTGQMQAQSNDGTNNDFSISSATALAPNILVPYNVSSRHGSTFLQGALDGVEFTANTTPTSLPDVESADLDLAETYMGTIGTFRVWDKDIADTGLVEATNPSLEPSLSLTFEGVGTNSFVVNDWAE